MEIRERRIKAGVIFFILPNFSKKAIKQKRQNPGRDRHLFDNIRVVTGTQKDRRFELRIMVETKAAPWVMFRFFDEPGFDWIVMNIAAHLHHSFFISDSAGEETLFKNVAA